MCHIRHDDLDRRLIDPHRESGDLHHDLFRSTVHDNVEARQPKGAGRDLPSSLIHHHFAKRAGWIGEGSTRLELI